jgi:hypothetical protein
MDGVRQMIVDEIHPPSFVGAGACGTRLRPEPVATRDPSAAPPAPGGKLPRVRRAQGVASAEHLGFDWVRAAR